MSARGLAARGAITLLALLPGLVLQCIGGDPALPRRLGFAVLLAIALESIALRIRRQPLRPYLLEGSAVLTALLLVLWLPAVDGWRLALAVFVAIVVARQAFGGLGAQRFSPVMAAVAVAQLILGVAAPKIAAPDALAIAWLLGGLLLCGLRITRWQLPLGLLAGAALATLLLGRDPLSIASAPWLLAAFFIATDPASGCEQPRARWLFAFVTGLLAVIASKDAGIVALPFALLAMNGLAPALDRRLEPRRTGAATP